MQVLTASTLLLLAVSPVAATEIQLLEPAPSRVLAPQQTPQPAPFPLLKPTAEAGAAGFVPLDGDNAPGAANVQAKIDSVVPTRETVCEKLADAATENGLPILFFVRLIWQESGFDPLAVSHAGAQGLAQFMPRVAAAMGLDDPFDPAQALPKSAHVLRSLRDQFGNLGLAAAAYNAGPKRVQDWLEKGRRLPKETRDYVRNVTGHAPELWAKQGPQVLAMTAPERLPCRVPDVMSADASPMAVPMVKVAAAARAAPTARHAPSRSLRPLHFIEPGPDLAHARPAREAIYVRRGRQKRSAVLIAQAHSQTERRMSARTHQQRAIILVHHRPGRSAVRMAGRQERSTPKRVRFALATRPSHAVRR
jgi:hypothetical protein